MEGSITIFLLKLPHMVKTSNNIMNMKSIILLYIEYVHKFLVEIVSFLRVMEFLNYNFLFLYKIP